MDIVGSKATHKRLWAGQSFHPFLQKVDLELTRLGYLFDGFNATERTFGSANWVAPLFPGYETIIEITSKNRDLIVDKSNIWISCTFRIESGLQNFLNTALDIKCYGRNSRHLVGLELLNWVASEWSPKRVGISTVWQNISTNDSEEPALILVNIIENQGKAFLDHLRSPTKLADSLIFKTSCGETQQRRLISDNPEIYAIVALLSGGFKIECLALLDQYKREIEERRIRMVASAKGDNESIVSACQTYQNQIKQLESWIQAPMGKGIEIYMSKF